MDGAHRCGPAVVAYVAAFCFVFPFPTLVLLRAWVGGNHSAFPADANAVPWSYALVNPAFGIGLGLVVLGHRLGARRRAAGAELAADRA